MRSPVVGVVGVNESAHPVLAAGDADHDEILHRQRRNCETVSGSIVRGNFVPHDVAGLRVERDDVRIERSEKNFVAQNRQSAIHMPAARTNIRRELPLIHPDWPPGARIERKGAVVLRGGIKNSVDHQRRSLQLSGRCGLVDPLRHQAIRIREIDLIESAEPFSGIVARVSHPVLRFFGRIQQSLKGDLRISVTSENARNQPCQQRHEGPDPTVVGPTVAD